MASCSRNSILGRRALSQLPLCGICGFHTQGQHASEVLTKVAALACRILPISGSHACSTVNGSVQHQQHRSKVTNKTTTKSQRHHLHIPPKREAEIRRFWTEVREVQDLACLQRFANFARVYPRYRDLQWLDTFMPQWDSAIDRLVAHDMGKFPANQLARKHPFILNAKIEPLQWAKMAVRGRLPAYAWKEVLNDIKRAAGVPNDATRTSAAGKIFIDNPNKAWRSPNEPKEPGDFDRLEGAEIPEEEEELWLETVNASAAKAAASISAGQ